MLDVFYNLGVARGIKSWNEENQAERSRASSLTACDAGQCGAM